jgi:hypothetical protein
MFFCSLPMYLLRRFSMRETRHFVDLAFIINDLGNRWVESAIVTHVTGSCALKHSDKRKGKP